MNINDLNKNQIILLTLLVSFVTSIATGIVTVTLMDQAPPGVTQTINRVVERTVERVVPGEVKTTTVIKEVPVMITEEDTIVDVYRRASPSVVEILDSPDDRVLGSGFTIDEQGTIVTAAGILAGAGDLRRGRVYQVVFSGGERIKVSLVKSSSDLDLAILRPEDSALFTATVGRMMAAVNQGVSSTTSPLPVWEPLELLVGNEIISGQTVIALGLTDSRSAIISGGIVSAVSVASGQPNIRYIKTNAVNQSNLGGPVLNTKGLVIGLGQTLGNAIDSQTIHRYLTAVD